MMRGQEYILRNEFVDALQAIVFLVAFVAGAIWGAVEGWVTP